MYGYIRVSTKEQNEDRQLIALNEYNVPEKNIYMDKQSGKDFDRKQYKRMLKSVKENDLIIIKSIDRLGRNYAEILEQWRTITKIKKADIFVIDISILNIIIFFSYFFTMVGLYLKECILLFFQVCNLRYGKGHLMK